MADVGVGDCADAFCALGVVVLGEGVEDAVGGLGAANNDDASFAGEVEGREAEEAGEAGDGGIDGEVGGVDF